MSGPLSAGEAGLMSSSLVAAAPEIRRTAPGHNLPAQPTPLLGRVPELQAGRDYLLTRVPAVRLLTLTGPGGTGKTRLALELAASVAEMFAGGVFFVDLAPVGDARLVLSTIARTVGLRDS